ncbi:MAG: hypothetical protein EOO63_04660 [Hymenobacter sp.]|nr:MAG: hypothetical protein EOO63_04660 [Hymenobacter sp.]
MSGREPEQHLIDWYFNEAVLAVDHAPQVATGLLSLVERRRGLNSPWLETKPCVAKRTARPFALKMKGK